MTLDLSAARELCEGLADAPSEELNGHIEIVQQCRDYLDHEAMDSGDPSGKLRDFVTSLSVVVDRIDRVPALLAEVDRLRGALDQWQRACLDLTDNRIPDLHDEADALRLEVARLTRISDIARRVVSRAIHRRQDHREVLLRNVELLPNDIEALAKLAEAVGEDKAPK